MAGSAANAQGAPLVAADRADAPATSRSGAPIRMLVFTREGYPTFRVDLEVLFGEELIGRGHEIDFVMQAERADVRPGPRAWHGRTVWVGPTDTGDGFTHRLRRQLLDLWHDLRHLHLTGRDRYDAVQVRDKFLFAAVAVALARRRGQRFFFWLSFPEPESQLARVRDGLARYPLLTYLRGHVSKWLLYRWILPRSDHVFVQSQRMKEDVAAEGIDPASMTPVPMGIATAEIRALAAVGAAPAAAASAALTLAYLGTLNAQRKLEILVEMLAIVRSRGMPVKLLLVGDGDDPSDRARLEQRARQLGVRDDLEITGFLPRSEALRRVMSADICLSPFHPTQVLLSTSPTKLVEYLALGMPVVANDHPEQRLILRQSRAGVCVPWGARHFARAVTWLAQRSPAERHAMGKLGRQWVLENRTYTRIADALEQRYRLLLGSTAQRRS